MTLDRRTLLQATAASLAAGLTPGRLHAQGAGPGVLVTGCSSGFGRLTALEFARAGYRVAATMRNVETTNAEAAGTLRTIAAEEGLDLTPIELDVMEDASVRQGVETATQALDRIDVLVSNAGIGIPLPLEMSMDATREVMETNFYGALRLAHAVLPQMRERKQGLMVQVTSGLGRISLPLYGAYTASKHALEAAFDAFAYELHPFGIETAMIQPGGYDTEFKENAAEDVARVLDSLPEDAKRIYGDHLEAVQNILRNVSTPPPRQIAQAILALAEIPRGTRPLRVVEGPGMSALPPINDKLTAITESSVASYLDRPEWRTLS